MNKYTLYLPLFFALFALAGCEKEHTGYLFTENARYPIDSLKIIRYEDYNQEVIRLEEQLNSYSGEILDSLNAYRTIEAEEEKIIEELDRLEGIMNKHGEKLNAYLDQFEDESDADPDRVQELTDNCEKAYEAWVTYELEVYQPVYQIRDRIERKIKALCQEAGWKLLSTCRGIREIAETASFGIFPGPPRVSSSCWERNRLPIPW